MKRILALVAIIAAAAAGAAVFAKQRGQDIGEFAGEWADRAREVESAEVAAAEEIDLREGITADQL